MKTLQQLCQEAEEKFRQLNFIKKVKGRAGRAPQDRSFRAVFAFESENEQQARDLTNYFRNKNYPIDYTAKEPKDNSNIWTIILISKEGKTHHQEKNP